MNKLNFHRVFILSSFLALNACQKPDPLINASPAQKQKASEQVPNTTPPANPPQTSVSTSTPLTHQTAPLQGIKEFQTLCGSSIGVKNTDTSSSRPVRFATFNMYGAFSTSIPSLKARIETMATALSKTDADVIGIQEAEDMMPEGKTVEILARRLSELSKETWYWCFFRSNPHAPGDGDPNPGGGGLLSSALALIDGNTKKLNQTSWYMGDAIISRLPFASTGARRISPRVLTEIALCKDDLCRQWATGESRVVIRAEVQLQGRSFHFFNSHFYTNITADSPTSQARQVSEVNQYVNDVLAIKNIPAAITCDCNSPENGAVRAEFVRQNFTDAWSMVNPGVSGFTGGQSSNARTVTAQSRIDYIFLKNLTPKEAKTFPSEAVPTTADPSILWPSDHLGVVAGPF